MGSLILFNSPCKDGAVLMWHLLNPNESHGEFGIWRPFLGKGTFVPLPQGKLTLTCWVYSWHKSISTQVGEWILAKKGVRISACTTATDAMKQL